jgi:hypothetical protein
MTLNMPLATSFLVAYFVELGHDKFRAVYHKFAKRRRGHHELDILRETVQDQISSRLFG